MCAACGGLQMLAEQRHQYILAQVTKNGALSVAELVHALGFGALLEADDESTMSPEQLMLNRKARMSTFAFIDAMPAIKVCAFSHGKLSEAPTIATSSGKDRLDQAALKVTQAGSGKFQPAIEDGKPVGACFNFGIRFKLCQNHCRDFRRRKTLSFSANLNLNMGIAIGCFDNLIRYPLRFVLYFLKFSAHEPLD